jgi:hypothetical protein
MTPPPIPARFIRSVTPTQISDYPALAALLTLWERKRRGRLAPQRRDFTAEDLHLWFGNLMVIDVVEGGQDFRYRVYGTDIATAYGHDMTNRLASEFPAPVAEFVLSNYREIVTDMRPMFCEHTPPLEVSVYSWQRLILPLSEDGASVSQILVAIYPSQARHDMPVSRALLP